MLITQAEAAKKYGITPQAIYSKAKAKRAPAWLIAVKGRKASMVDETSEAWHKYISKAVSKKAKLTSEDPVSKILATPIAANHQDPKEDPQLSRLKKQASLAGYAEDVMNMEIKRYKVEQSKIEMKKEAGELIEWTICDALFLSYCKRINTEKLRLAKKMEPDVSRLISDEILRELNFDDLFDEEIGLLVRDRVKKLADPVSRKITKWVEREEEVILRDVQQQQTREVIRWKEER